MSASPSTSSSSSSSFKFTYDVFLNFRGTDTRLGFTGNLYKVLDDKGFRTFFDDEELQKGEKITPALVKAIQESRIAITIFSKNYAYSPFCLDELVKIMECVKTKGMLVLPVFYDVDPCDVRHQRGTYGEALAQGRFKDDKEKVQKWREALHQAANLSGDNFKLGNEYEYVFIERIIKGVSKIISRVPLKVVDYPVGLESRIQKVYLLLNDGSDDGVLMVGICGIGGIGKSTLARAVYNLIANQFDRLCFLSDVREDSVKHGLLYLQQKLLSKVVRDNNIKIGSVHEGISIIKQRLHSKKVLLVVDNVDNCDQLEAIAGGLDWFGPGSRVIITTRGQDLLVNHGIERKYEVEGLNEKEARELFTRNAFKCDKVDPSFTEVINQAVTYASGLPLALEVIGSNLFRKKIKVWESELDQYKRIPVKKIQNILKVSYDSLEEDHQQVFLDIACCFRGYQLEEIEEILHAHYGFSVENCISKLVDKSLIKIDADDDVTLHDLIQDMGLEIVRQASTGTLGKRSRLGVHQEILQLLKNDAGTDKIEMINLKLSSKIFGEKVEWERQAFQKMKNLKTLIISGCFLAKDVEHLPNSLRVLKWEEYPSASLPSDFHPENLAILEVSSSRQFESMQLAKTPKKFLNMRVLNLGHNSLVKHIPDLSSVPNLEELSFEWCRNLIKVDKSVGFLTKLRMLNVNGCTLLKSFPPLKLISLEKLNLSDCLSLEKFPEILGKMENVSELILWGLSSIKEFPYSIGNLTQLRRMHLEYCRSFRFPSGIFALKELDDLKIVGCEGLLLPNQDESDDQVSSSMLSSNATHLHFRNCNAPCEFLQIVLPRFLNVKVLLFLQCAKLTILPACIEECRFLRKLQLVDCERLEEIRGIPPNIERLFAIYCTSLSSSTRRKLSNKKWHEEGGNKMITWPGTEIPSWFEHRSKEPSISFWFRNKFPAISLCFKIEYDLFGGHFYPELIINDKKVFLLDEKSCYAEYHHINIFDRIQTTFKDGVDEVLSENEWNRVVFSPSFTDFCGWPVDVALQIGLHIIKKSSMDDVRFTDPMLQKEEHRSVNTEDSQSRIEFVHQEQQEEKLASSEPLEGQGRESLPFHPPPTINDNVNWGSSSKRIRSTTTVTVQGLQEEHNLTSINQHTIEESESVDITCNINVGEHNGKDPLTELLSTTKDSKKQKSSDLKFKIFGWIILAIGIVAWARMTKSQIPPPPPT